MIEINNIQVYNINGSIFSARNSFNSWDKWDSKQYDVYYYNDIVCYDYSELGDNDKELWKKLCKAGSSHRKFLRQIFVSMNITASLKWWKQFDTYKIGTVSNSTSTMHTLTRNKITPEMIDLTKEEITDTVQKYIDHLNNLILSYNHSKDSKTFELITNLLPTGFKQMRYITLNYENLLNIYTQRKSHKLKDWIVFCDKIKTLPYINLTLT